VHEVWKWNSGFTITSAPAVSEGVVVIGDASGSVHALRDMDGESLWVYHTKGPVFGTPAIAESRVVVASADSTAYCLDLATGIPLWQFKDAAPIVASPAIAGNRVFLGGSGGRFRALDLATGTELWSYDSVGGFVETRPLIHDNTVFFGAWDETFYALDALAGGLRWKWRSPRRGLLYSPAACWPAAVRRQLFLVAPDRAMTVLDCTSGKEIWRSTSHQVRESIGMTSDSALIVVRTMRDSLIAFDAHADVPREMWVSTPGIGYDINAAMPVEKGGTLFYGSKNGYIFALAASDGSVVWVHRTGASVVNTLTPLSATAVLASDFDGNVMLLSSGSR
jgi:outer membrane protein assembly factor BamB